MHNLAQRIKAERQSLSELIHLLGIVSDNPEIVAITSIISDTLKNDTLSEQVNSAIVNAEAIADSYKNEMAAWPIAYWKLRYFFDDDEWNAMNPGGKLTGKDHVIAAFERLESHMDNARDLWKAADNLAGGNHTRREHITDTQFSRLKWQVEQSRSIFEEPRQ